MDDLTTMLRLAEQQATSATSQAAAKNEWVENQRTELAGRERELTGELSGLYIAGLCWLDLILNPFHFSHAISCLDS